MSLPAALPARTPADSPASPSARPCARGHPCGAPCSERQQLANFAHPATPSAAWNSSRRPSCSPPMHSCLFQVCACPLPLHSSWFYFPLYPALKCRFHHLFYNPPTTLTPTILTLTSSLPIPSHVQPLVTFLCQIAHSLATHALTLASVVRARVALLPLVQKGNSHAQHHL